MLGFAWYIKSNSRSVRESASSESSVARCKGVLPSFDIILLQETPESKRCFNCLIEKLKDFNI